MVGTNMTNTSLIEKIGKLLAQAENTTNEAEAGVFLAKAQQLATLYSVDLAKARHATQAKHRTVPVTRQVVVGARGTRGLSTLVELLTNIGEANGLRCTIASKSTWVNFFGFAEDIDITEALYASLVPQMVKASEEFKRSGAWKADEAYVAGRYKWVDERTGKSCSSFDYHAVHEWVEGGYRPVSWLSARLDFQQAFASRIGVRLHEANRAAEREVQEQDAVRPDSSAGTELVLADKRREVRDFYARETRHIRSVYRGGRSGVSSSTSYEAGSSAGRSASIGSTTAVGGSNKALV